MTRPKKMQPGVPESIPKDTLVALCMAAGFTRIKFHFDGSGDSGQIEAIDGYKSSDKAAASVDVPQALYVELEKGAYGILERHFPGDWVNNDGGFGSIVLYLDADDPCIVLEAHQRITTTEDSEITLGVDEIALEEGGPS